MRTARAGSRISARQTPVGVRRALGASAAALVLLASSACGIGPDETSKASDDDGKDRKTAKPLPSVPYTGPEILGVRTKPRWKAAGVPEPPKSDGDSDDSNQGWNSEEDEGPTKDELASRTSLFAVGDSFAVIRPEVPKKSQNGDDGDDGSDEESDGPPKRTVTVYDAASGKQLASIPKVLEAEADRWDGKPALLVTGAKGLITVFDEHGKKVTKLDRSALNVSDGWVVRARGEDEDGDQKDGLALADANGAVKHEVGCEIGNSYRCEFPTGFLGAPPQEDVTGYWEFSLPMALGPYGFHTEEIEDDERDRKLVVEDMASGSTLWNTGDIQRPKGVIAHDDVYRQVEAQPMAAWDGKVLLAWPAAEEDDSDGSDDSDDSDDSSGSDESSYRASGASDDEAEQVLALHDGKTGKLLATGPKVADPDNLVFDPSHKVAVVSSKVTEDRPYPPSVAWDLTSGKTLWKDDSGLGTAAQAIAGGVVYLKSDDGAVLGTALSLKDGQPVSTDAGRLYDVRAADNGYVAALTTTGLFTFPPKGATR